MQIGLSLSLTAQLRSSSTYAVLGYDPALVFDFKGNYFRKSATDSTFGASITHTRASSATMVNSSGTLVTVGNNVPRTGHHLYNGSTWVNEGILHESEARTNLILHSSDYSFNHWSKSASTVSGSSTAPDGTSTAQSVTPSSASSRHFLYKTAGNSNMPAVGVTTTTSIFAKADGYNFLGIADGTSQYGRFNLTTGQVVLSVGLVSTSIESYGGGWYRCSITSTGTISRQQIFSVNEDAANVSSFGAETFVGNGTSGITMYGAQTEAGSTPSSYIPTTTATATRAADLLTVPAANLPYDSTNMSIQIDGKMTGNTLTPVRWLLDANNSILLETGSNNFSFTQEAVGTVDTVTGGSFTSGTNVPFNLATRNGSTFINGAISGTVLTANTTPTALPNLSSTGLNLGHIFMGTIGQFRMWDEDLTDAGITEAST